MRRAGKVVRQVLDCVRDKVKPGATTQDLENAAEALLKELGAKAAFKGSRRIARSANSLTCGSAATIRRASKNARS